MTTRQWIGAALTALGVAIYFVGAIAVTLVWGVGRLNQYWPVWILALVCVMVGMVLGKERRS